MHDFICYWIDEFLYLSDTVILAYGAYAKRPVVVERVEQVMEMLKPHKKKVKKLINPVSMSIFDVL
jgi:hypothetical protein